MPAQINGVIAVPIMAAMLLASHNKNIMFLTMWPCSIILGEFSLFRTGLRQFAHCAIYPILRAHRQGLVAQLIISGG